MSIKKVLIIGSGPIQIGQGAEFDYSGTQACKAIREEGLEVVLINSNPATIMTDKSVAHYTYIEPLTIEFLEKVISKEKPDSLIAGMGGQTGLNLACELYDLGILKKYSVEVIGTSIESIKKGEDRESFKALMEEINEPLIESEIVNTVEEGLVVGEKIGFPLIVRPAYTLGGSGGGIAETKEELEEILEKGLYLSRVSQVLVEKSIKGWKEIEFEVLRDGAGNCIQVCSMENLDPVGVHTGDSIVVAPTQTLTDKEFQMLRSSAIRIINAIKIKGGCNVQFALNPKSFEYAIIEINPRVSRSSALASKATGYPIAKVATKISLGYNLDEIKNDVTKKTTACFEPALDYVVVKIPKWPFDKFIHGKRTLGTKMMATGEIMAIGRNFEEALLKGIRSLEINQFTLELPKSKEKTLDELKKSITIPDDERLFDLSEIIRRGYLLEKIYELTGIDPFYIEKIKEIIKLEESLKGKFLKDISLEELLKLKIMGFSDKGISQLIETSPEEIYKKREEYNIKPVYKMVDTCAGEFEAVTPYYYSTYEIEDEVLVNNNKKIIVLGSGPIRIGQGIEFDYCSVRSIMALKEENIETIIINNNPETVSTDFDIADKLYFEPLTEEDVYNVILKEKPSGVILQFGGQTAIKLAKFLNGKNINIYGTKPEAIDHAEDRDKFEKLLNKHNIKRPTGEAVWNVEEGILIGEKIGYPVLVRPSYVLGGQGMEIVYSKEKLKEYLLNAFKNSKNSVLIDMYLMGREIEVDAICDGTDIFIPGIMEHLERAGVHSGDSISIYPSQNISLSIKEKIVEITKLISLELNIIGLINLQFIEYKNDVYIIEVNPRSSRTIPYISKVTGIPIIDLGTKVMLGHSLKEMEYTKQIGDEPNFVTVKAPIFSTEKLPDVEVSLGPEMRSTGEVLGIGRTYEEALTKGFIATGRKIPKCGDTILVTISKNSQMDFLPIAKTLHNIGCKFIGTEGTCKFLQNNSIDCKATKKISEGVPNVLDVIRSGIVNMVVDIPTRTNNKTTDGFKIRRTALETGINTVTSLDTLRALALVSKNKIAIENLEIFSIADLI
ncbi:MAG: carbamoyl-phosphate synthase large subunit [Lachnospirales bacterium]